MKYINFHEVVCMLKIPMINSRLANIFLAVYLVVVRKSLPRVNESVCRR